MMAKSTHRFLVLLGLISCLISIVLFVGLYSKIKTEYQPESPVLGLGLYNGDPQSASYWKHVFQDTKGNNDNESLKPQQLNHSFQQVLLKMKVDRIRSKVLSCKDLFEGNGLYKLTEENLKNKTENIFKSNNLQKAATNCGDFTKHRLYITEPLSEEEADFPIAYGILVYKDPEQAEGLLQAIYQPQNMYCIHVDSKSDASVHRNMQHVAKCFSNVFLAEHPTKVVYGAYGILEAELICMKELVERSRSWKYYINLTGQEYPLRTNRDIVKVLTILHGGNDIYGVRDRSTDYRWNQSHAPHSHHRAKAPPPHNITIHKGSTHILASRAFIHFILTDPRVQEFLHWLRDTRFPEELFFASIHNNPHLGAPGAYSEDAIKQRLQEGQISRYKQWRSKHLPCHGQYLRNICIPGARNLPSLYNAHKLFVNKLLPRVHPIVSECLQELHWNRTKDQALGLKGTDDSHTLLKVARSLPIVKHHI